MYALTYDIVCYHSPQYGGYTVTEFIKHRELVRDRVRAMTTPCGCLLDEYDLYDDEQPSLYCINPTVERL